MIGRFRSLHPGLQVSVADPARRSDVLDAVRLGGAELGLLDGPPPGGRLSSRWVTDQELVGVLPADAPPSEGPTSVEELLRWGLICTPAGTALRSLLDAQLDAVGQPADVAVETAHLATVVPLVLAGAGAAMLPQGLAGEAAAKGARVLPLDPPTRTSVHVVWRTGALSTPAEHFLEACLPDDAAPMAADSSSDSRSV
jgi:DNA-binding transcriptional LysR family regulator